MKKINARFRKISGFVKFLLTLASQNLAQILRLKNKAKFRQTSAIMVKIPICSLAIPAINERMRKAK